MVEHDHNRSDGARSLSPWAQLVLIAAAFCLGRELPSRFADDDVPRRAPGPATRQPVRPAPPAAPDIASLMPSAPVAFPSARPARQTVRTRMSVPPPNRKPRQALAELEPDPQPRDPVLSRVFFGVDPPGTLPTKISGPEISYTAPALDHEVEGIMRVACIVTKDGEVDRCRVLNGLPYMDVAVLHALKNRRYAPARLADGRPVETEYVFVVRLFLQGEVLVDG